uniref:Uncharacterized protein n=1 Tax=Amphimedon queenslandica TaxID=400682 RepID=A0A1X7TDK9_AMPQE
MDIKEAHIDNRQEHLDLLYFPTLFPTGQYGERHPKSKLSGTNFIILVNT